eukprot:CAMPEP_0197030228 /NCGR_PEP_ID=MMETSP1384-20130603/9499_1 /TAXON_ID=29189 /ORGANISM="Ammonia sp." /LENGTH=488 /DNA_ID=CAMNT_0042459531 /DNA_START=28 /DNA_END=1494 /DNA_ORIENTATION=+
MDSFVWSIFCIALFVLGFVLIFYTTDGLLKSLHSLADTFKWHPLIVGLVILGCDPQISCISLVSAFNGYQYLAIGSIIGNCIISLTLALCLPLILFREEPFLKVMAENLKKDEKLHIPSFYFKLLSILCVLVAFMAFSFLANYAYNLLLISLISTLFFLVYLSKNFLKYRHTQTLDIYIEPKHAMHSSTTAGCTTSIDNDHHHINQEQDERERGKLRGGDREDECYDDDTDDYDAIASAKEDYDEISDQEQEQQDAHRVHDEKMNIIDDDHVELGKTSAMACMNSRDDEEDAMDVIEMAHMTSSTKRGAKSSNERLAAQLQELQRNGGWKKIAAVIGYFVLLLLSGELCVYAAGELVKGSTTSSGGAVLNESIFGYVVVAAVTNLDSVVYAVNAWRQSKMTAYKLDVGRLIARLFWNLGLVFGVCGIWMKGIQWRMTEALNGIILAVSMVYVSWIVCQYQLKKVHGIGLLTIFGAYGFLNLVLDEIVE